MTETGTVIKLKKDLAVVRIERKSACDSCKMCAIRPNSPHIDVNVKNEVSAKVNDIVEIYLTDGAVIKSSLIVYVIPLVFALIGLIIGLMFKNQVAQLLMFVGFLVLGFVCVYLIDRAIRRKEKYKQKILKILNKEEK